MIAAFRFPILAGLAGGAMMCATPPAAAAADALRADWREQHQLLAAQLADRAWCARVAAQTEHPAALLEADDRDPLDVVLRRAGVLLAHLRERSGGPALAAEATALGELRERAAAVAPGEAAARYHLYEEACALRRRIAFANPLLDFDRLLFVTRHRTARGDHHMVDQYYGFNQKPGGAVMVLENPFGERPVARDLLAGRTVAGGRLDGRPLAGGSFTTLDLDFDGGEILFAWSECGEVPDDADWSGQPWDRKRAEDNRKPWYHWAPETTYHVFRAAVEGGPVWQLTDGPFNEFDPCFLPDGRVLFVSERRGGYLRCGGNRPNPNFTLHSMRRDGGDIIPLSFHETQEWNPSVDHTGMIVYTRWDYVDRDNDMAHHIWVCYPDGRDPRSYHANYPSLREGRPWMELAARSIPGSHRYVAVAAPHHGYHFGSLVLIDQSIEDDNLMAQTKRLTPEVHFPESEKAPGLPHKAGTHSPLGEVYGTPWSLDDWFHLCVYDPAMRRHGIYLVDAFGNRELIHRDPELSCLDPIPLRARPRPPVIPRSTQQAAEDRNGPEPTTGTVAVVNIYESDFAWPPGTKIAALRVIQLYPKSTWHMNEPMVGRGAESLARGVLGEVPVAADGSVHFELEAGVPVYFQAVDADGLAVQSMRSATYVHPGGRLTCVGCHESKDSSPATATAVPLAWQEPPARLTPAPEGALPLSFPRLVQPVLDRHCVACHHREADAKAPDLSGKPGPRHGWSAAFESLLPYAWALNGGNGIFATEGGRSQAGNLGARVAPLLGHLDRGHHGVELSAEDRLRITLWLDANSNFYGAYHDTAAQAAGERVEPEVR